MSDAIGGPQDSPSSTDSEGSYGSQEQGGSGPLGTGESESQASGSEGASDGQYAEEPGQQELGGHSPD